MCICSFLKFFCWNEAKIECEICNLLFDDDFLYQIHIATVHPGYIN